MKHFLLLTALALLPFSPAFAQGVVGPPAGVPPVTTGDCVKWINLSTIADSGGPCGGTGAPGGTTTQVQFNNAGSFGGITNGAAGTCLVSNGVSTTPSFASCSGGATTFSAITGSTNTTAAMVVGTGASLGVTGSGTITASGVPITGVTGMGTNVSTFLITPSSANLLAAMTTSTGTGNNVFGTAPTISSPTINTAATLGYITGSTQCLHVNTSGVLTGTGSDCGSGGGAVTSVTAGTSGSVSVAPTTGAVVVDLASQSNNTLCGNLSGSTLAPTCGNTLASVQTALISVNAQACTPTLVTGPTNDFDPTTGGTTCASAGAGITNVGLIIAAAASGGTTIDGMLAGSQLQQLVWFNTAALASGNNIVLKNQSASDTTAANRFAMAGDLVIPPQQFVNCFYIVAASTNRWICR